MELENRIIETLENLNPERPWMTAKGLSMRINRLDKSKHSEDAIATVLRSMEEQAASKIRRSKLPSAKSLDPLWGHLDHVGKKVVPPTNKMHLADSFFDEEVMDLDPNAPVCFLSHSHKDIDAVINIGKKIAELSYYPWTAEVDIEQESPINTSIIEALKEVDLFVVYITENSLKSIWTKKEFEFALGKFKKIVFLFESKNNGELLSRILGNTEGQVIHNSDLEAQATKSAREFAPRIRAELNSDKTIVAFDSSNDLSPQFPKLFTEGKIQTLDKIFSQH